MTSDPVARTWTPSREGLGFGMEALDTAEAGGDMLCSHSRTGDPGIAAAADATVTNAPIDAAIRTLLRRARAREQLESRQRSTGEATAAAHGLYFWQADYPPEFGLPDDSAIISPIEAVGA